jgi:hypothetical protein
MRLWFAEGGGWGGYGDVGWDDDDEEWDLDRDEEAAVDDEEVESQLSP